jgi:hypothetical protein
MTVRRNATAEAALQYLIWALEDIEKAGNQKAAHHARLAVKALRSDLSGDRPPEHAI